MRYWLGITDLKKDSEIATYGVIQNIVVSKELNQDLITIKSMFPKAIILYDCIDENDPLNTYQLISHNHHKLAAIGFDKIFFPILIDKNGLKVLRQLKNSDQYKRMIGVIKSAQIELANIVFELGIDNIFIKLDINSYDYFDNLKAIKNIRDAGMYKTRIISEFISKYSFSNQISDNAESIVIKDSDFESMFLK